MCNVHIALCRARGVVVRSMDDIMLCYCLPQT